MSIRLKYSWCLIFLLKHLSLLSDMKVRHLYSIAKYLYIYSVVSAKPFCLSAITIIFEEGFGDVTSTVLLSVLLGRDKAVPGDLNISILLIYSLWFCCGYLHLYCASWSLLHQSN